MKVKYYIPIINFPDPQLRIFKRTAKILWCGAVHEKIVGYQSIAHLPSEEQYSLLHVKTIERQEQQNKLYETI